MMVLSTIVFLTLVKILPKHRWVTVGGMVLSIALVLLSSSTTSLLILILLLSLFPLIRVLRRDPKRAAAALAIAVLLAIGASYWVTAHFDSALDLLGKDETLTGRTDLWAVAVVMALERPWLGYGYNAFWLGLGGPSAEVWRVVGWVPSHGHNGFLDVWLDLGLLGVAVFLFGFAVYSRRAVALLRKWHSPEALWPAIFLAYLFLSNLTESSLIGENSIFWVLYTATVLNISRECGRSAIPMNISDGQSDAWSALNVHS
jgi:O-antigen ligase